MVAKLEKPQRVEKVTSALNVRESAGITIGTCGNCGQGVSFNKGETTTKCSNCKFTVQLTS